MLLDIVVCSLPKLGGHGVCLDFLPAGRQLIEHGNVQFAVNYQRKRARNRRCRHDVEVRIFALFAQRVSLLNAEAVLLVGYDERERFKFNVRLDYGVSSYEQVYIARPESLFFSPFLSGSVRAG